MTPGRYQPTDYRVAIITGTTGGVTGGDIIPDGFIGVIKSITHSEMANTGQTVQLRTQPSGINLDARRLSAQENYPDSWEFDDEQVHGHIGSLNVLQVVTSAASVVTRIVYVIEEGRV